MLLLDEPLSALDLKLRKEMQIELKRLQLETRITFIFVTHDQEEALTMSDRIAVMSREDSPDRHSTGSANTRPIDSSPTSSARPISFGPRCSNASEPGVESACPRVGRDPRPGLYDAPVGSTVTLAIRPERIDMVKPGGECHLAGKESRTSSISAPTKRTTSILIPAAT